ncbi:MAG: hypothetical protein Q9169_002358 [Polycauliona sp. 2 TL-2023]
MATNEFALSLFQYSLTCTDALYSFTATSPPALHGSGSYISAATRCPRAKPTTTITSTVTYGNATVPTSPGFTPISSETDLATSTPGKGDSSIFVDFDRTGNARTDLDATLTSRTCGPVVSSTSSPTPTTCPSMSTITTSTTITTQSSIAFAACGDHNIVSFVTDPARENQLTSISTLKLFNVTGHTSYTGIGVSDCCAACQIVGCAYGTFILPLDTDKTRCELYFQEECDGSEWLGSTFSYDTPGSQSFANSDGFTLFNGPCGQIVPNGPSP